jgi:uncharacterized repeat protein (TIGR01451 family)
MSHKRLLLFSRLLIVAFLVVFSTREALTFPSLTAHPHNSSIIEWEQDGTKDGSSPHNHYSATYFGGLGIFTHPYTVTYCWDNTTYRRDRVGTFDNGHCFIDKADNSNIPKYFFVGAGWPAEAKQRIREAFAAWSAVTSGKPRLVTGIAFQESGSEAGALIKIYWDNQGGANNGGYWQNSDMTLHMDNSMSWYFGANPNEGNPGGIQNNQWHFYSVVLHELGHGVGLNHQTDADDVMSPPVGEPPNVAGHRYFMGLDADSIQAVRDLYSQPRQRVAFVIDDTGSMGEEIGLVKTTVNSKVDELVAQGKVLEYHLETYKDDVSYIGFTNDAAEIKGWVNGLSASGGGDCPEEMLGALNRIADEAPYSEAWLMTDAGFHGGLGDVAATIFKLIQNHVTVHPIVYSWCFEAEGGVTLPTGEDAGQSGGGRQPVSPEATTQVGPEAFAQIARETGGHYFLITTGETQDAALILLNEMITQADLATYSGQLNSGSPIFYNVQVGSDASELNFLLNSYNGFASLTLTDPNGVTVPPGGPGVTYTAISNAEYYQIDSPSEGTWTATIAGDGEFTLSVSAASDIVFENLSDSSLALDVPASILVSLSGDIASAAFKLTELDGTLVDNLTLFDDGAHGDGSAGDGVFAGTYTPGQSGSFYLRAEGTSGDGSAFERVAAQILRVHTLSLSTAPGSQTVLPGSSAVYQFQIHNGATISDTFSLSVASTQGWADFSGVPGSVTLEAGETVQYDVTVNVPAGASSGTVDETTLSAVSLTDPLINDVATASTTALIAADLAVEIQDNPDPVDFGEVIYTVRVSNTGPLEATNIVFTDTVFLGTPSQDDDPIDPQLQAVGTEPIIKSITASQGTCTFAGSSAGCDLGAIPSGGFATVTVVVDPADLGSVITNVALATADEDDPDSSNNTAAESTQVQITRLVLPIILKR